MKSSLYEQDACAKTIKNRRQIMILYTESLVTSKIKDDIDSWSSLALSTENQVQNQNYHSDGFFSVSFYQLSPN